MSRDEIAELAFAQFGRDNWNRAQSSRDRLRFGHKGSVAVDLAGPKAGLWFDFEGHRGGRIGNGKTEASDRPSRPKDLLTWDSPSADRFRTLVTLELSPVTGRAAAYLERRHIPRAPHSVCTWGDDLGIAYIAQSDDGTRLAAQVLPLTMDGRKNAQYWSDGVTKRTFAAARGWNNFAAVRMPGRGEPILCEGPETGMSIWQATGRTVLATMGGAGLKTLRTRARSVTLALDADAEGSPAWTFGEDAARHRRSLGQKVTVVRAQAVEDIKSADFNDIDQASVRAAFAR